MWEIFGGTTTDKGYKLLDSHIGLIYGDSITLQRQKAILEGLKEKGFASFNVVLGIGSYTYEYVTRDTYGFAMKATYGEVNGEGRNIFKDPKTDDGTKKSAKGLLAVHQVDGKLQLKDECSWEEEKQGLLQTVFENGKVLNEQSLSQIRERIVKELEKEALVNS
jgi:nicotinamide phosphoribosyltransferase